jgi:choline transporter-like protein 2/4/5
LLDTDQYTDPTSSSYLTSPLLPVIFVMFIAYCEADVFLSVYEMAVDTAGIESRSPRH